MSDPRPEDKAKARVTILAEDYTRFRAFFLEHERREARRKRWVRVCIMPVWLMVALTIGTMFPIKSWALGATLFAIMGIAVLFMLIDIAWMFIDDRWFRREANKFR